jgi:uncharacterized protein (TIGR03437 family)
MRLFFAALALSVPVFAQTCTYTSSPASVTLPATASTGSVLVTTGNGCTWTASSASPSWFGIVGQTQFVGSGTVSYLAAVNNLGQQRTSAIVLTDSSKVQTPVPVTQDPANCTYALNPQSAAIGTAGGAGQFQVATGCVWQVAGVTSFITVADKTVHPGAGVVNYTVAANTCVYGRSGSIGIATSTSGVAPVFSLTQDGSPSNMIFTPAGASASAAASDGRFTITTGTGCTWSAYSDVTWIQIVSGASGSGNGAVSYHLLANSTAPRTGNIHIGNLTFTVSQASSGPPAPTVAAVESAANYRGDAVAPGEIVSIFGANMGPSKIVTLQLSGGYVANLLSGTQVLFDGVPAPIVFTLDKQVSAVVPYGVGGKSSTQVQVVYNGQTSNTVTIPVQAAHPAIFTLDTTGLGPGAILNQDYSINSSTNGAARGSVVAIYATGGGATSPVLADGAVTGTDLPRLTQPVSVTIGGFDATVTYSGGAPGAVAGLTQINAKVPDGVTPGIAVPVVVRIGNYASSAGVTLSVR